MIIPVAAPERATGSGSGASAHAGLGKGVISVGFWPGRSGQRVGSRLKICLARSSQRGAPLGCRLDAVDYLDRSYMRRNGGGASTSLQATTRVLA
jgi:hypothetical protein